VTKLDLTHSELLADWSKTKAKNDEIGDPSQPAETELLEYILECGLGAVEMQRLREEAGRPKQRKSILKAGNTSVEEAGTPAPRSRKRKSNDAEIEVADVIQLVGTADISGVMPLTAKPRQEA